jgi:hypothetical protein
MEIAQVKENLLLAKAHRNEKCRRFADPVSHHPGAYRSTLGRRMFIGAFVFGLLIFQIGCARLTSIYRHQTLDETKPQLTSIDAKQRVILTAPDKKAASENGEVYLRFCAEPPPDVFTALATSLGAEASVGQGIDPAIAAKIASSISENASTIERTQTVNVLRESMYRNCERFLSGAIEPSEFIVQAARDQQLIIQVLAIEQITGVARSQATALTTVAKAASSGASDTTVTAFVNAKKDYDSKLAASTKAASDAAALQPTGACADAINETTPPTGTTVDQAKAKNAACKAQKSAEAATKESKAYYDTLQKALDQQTALSTEAQGQFHSAAGSALASSEAIAKQVVEIVKRNQAFDEIGMTCVVWLRRHIDDKASATLPVPDYCKALLEMMARARQSELLAQELADSPAIMAEFDKLQTVSKSNADQVWAFLLKANDKSVGLKTLETAINATVPDARRTRLVSAVASNDQTTFNDTFATLPTGMQQTLAKATTTVQPN